MTRTQAAQAGERFFSTKPCKHDGDNLRYTASAQCVTCSKRRSLQQQQAIQQALKAGKIPA